MPCSECKSTHVRKNGKRSGKQNHICVACRHQFIDHYTPLQGYSETVKRECLRSVNGMDFRALERVKGVHHTTVIAWLKQVGARWLAAYAPETAPAVGALDELETFVGSKKPSSGSGQPLTTSNQAF